MDSADPIDQISDEAGRREWLITQVAASLPGVGRERLPGLGGEADWPEGVGLLDHPVYGDAFLDPQFQIALSTISGSSATDREELRVAALKTQLEFLRAAITPRNGKAGLSPILTCEIYRVLAEELVSLRLADPAESRRQVNWLDELASEQTRLGCIPASDQLLTLRAAFGEESLPEQREWRMEELLEKYLSTHHALAKQREHSPEPDQRARSRAMMLFESDAIRLCGDASPRLPVEDAVELTRLIVELDLVKSPRERRRLVALARHGSYRIASREVRENAGSFHKAIRRLSGCRRTARAR